MLLLYLLGLEGLNLLEHEGSLLRHSGIRVQSVGWPEMRNLFPSETPA